MIWPKKASKHKEHITAYLILKVSYLNRIVHTAAARFAVGWHRNLNAYLCGTV